MQQRKHDRYTPKALMRAINALHDVAIGNVVNISQGGFMLSSHGIIIPEGTIYQLQLMEDSAKLNINAGATCLWQTEANAKDSHWAGFQIIDISPEDEETLKSYLSGLDLQPE